MDYETFDDLHKRDPLLFSLAMELFLDKGRIDILESGQEELTTAILQKLAALLTEVRLRDTIEAATAFARLETGALLRYAERSGYFIGEDTETPTPDDSF